MLSLEPLLTALQCSGPARGFKAGILGVLFEVYQYRDSLITGIWYFVETLILALGVLGIWYLDLLQILVHWYLTKNIPGIWVSLNKPL